jgi:cytochrome c-type biogenesis protein
MGALILASASALWLGILTSISPCPLATNIAAIGYVGRRAGRTGAVLASGVLYTAGRALAYVGLGVVLSVGLLSVPQLSQALQTWVSKLVGPVLILAGMVLLDLIPFRPRGGGLASGAERWTKGLGLWGAVPLGVLFALSFCPVSAAIFFGALVPLALEAGSGLLLPAVYGIGTALPVVAFAVLLSLGAESLARAFGAVQRVEVWFRRATGVVLIGAGIYLSLVHIFGLTSGRG